MSSLAATASSSSDSVHYDEDDHASTIRQPSFHLSDVEDLESDDHEGDYSTRMEELMDDGEDSDTHDADEIDGEGDGFLYTGLDAADMSTGYKDTLRDVLGPDHDEDDEDEMEEPPSLLLRVQDMEKIAFNHELHTPVSTPPRVDSPGGTSTPSKLARPFLHPTVSRLRSYTPQSSQVPSSGTFHSQMFDGTSSPSHFSAMSRTSSVSNFNGQGHSNGKSHSPRQVFKWTPLRNIGDRVYAKTTQKATSILGVASLGSPTVLAANGYICIGTDTGSIYVYDFRQNLKCICGADSVSKSFGAVTALALSHDHTYVASGHATGHIQLFDLKNPQVPARSVPPVTLTSVSTGRQEGHIQGSRIVNVDFVAGRHTAIVTADEHGLAFYHSLGKVLFVDASDILRILGKYPRDELPASRPATNGSAPLPPPSAPPPRRRNTRYTVLAMMPLPLGTSPHSTDAYNVVALLTPTKLVVVGLKPTPKTWFKRVRGDDEQSETKPKSRRKGALSWFPSIIANGKEHPAIPTTPILAYSWGNNLHLIRVSESRSKQTTMHSRTGKPIEVEVGRIVFEDVGTWSADEDILALQWLNANQVVLLTATSLEVYDARRSKSIEKTHFDGLSLVSPTLAATVNGAVPYAESIGNVAHSMRVYKGKIFLLGREQMQVGTLLTWADRILSFVEDGDFLSAIDLTRSYYVGDAPGNRNGLPDDPQLRKEEVGEKMRDLMVASVRYAFSEDRMTDGTHVTPDGRGVDRTSLFEGLVTTCARACIALDDYEFLFEDLFQEYDDTRITRIFLQQLEPFMLDSEIRYVPPRITQRLVAMHDDDERPDLVERVIWHVDPSCLDINQAIQLCQAHHLYDALIYVYTRALRDYVAPIVELVDLVRKVQKFRRSGSESPENATENVDIEPIIINAYKIYPYLANILSGLVYPSEEPLDVEEALQAKKDVYTFLFNGCSSVWPLEGDGKLVLTSDEEGGVEPTYPYARLLLRFDAESFLHTLDIAFEDVYFNEESRNISRLLIVRILLEILSSGDLPAADITFVNIFIARNVPKYPQYLDKVTSSALHSILVGLAEDPDPNTREDRQLAAEYLLSNYTPHESERILQLFEEAGFYRILRSWHRHERQWAPLLSAYLDDPDLHPSELFESAEDVLTLSTRANKGLLPAELLVTISDALPKLLKASITSTAVLLDRHNPDLHSKAIEDLGADADYQQFVYLRHLLGPHLDDDEYTSPSRLSGPSMKVPPPLRHLYVSLQCKYNPDKVIEALKYLPPDLLDWDDVLQTCESHEVYNAAVWASNWRGDTRGALSKAEKYEKRLTLKIADILANPTKTPAQIADVQREVKTLEAVSRVGVAICLERSQGPSATEVPLEDIWFQLLSSQIHCVQSVSGCCSAEALAGQIGDDESTAIESETLSSLRSLVQETFGALVSISSTRAVSFPRLFKRLVNPATQGNKTQYTEFRTILTGMLESYRSDGDILVITKRLVDRDLYETVADVVRERARGWAAGSAVCLYCRKPLLGSTRVDQEVGEVDVDIVVSRTGSIYHHRCLPADE